MLQPGLKKILTDRFQEDVIFDEPMAFHTSIGIGGPADAFIQPKTQSDLIWLVNWSRQENIPCLVIGDGTNLLVRDGGIRGIVVTLSKFEKNYDTKLEADQQVLVTLSAGMKLAEACKRAIRAGWEGLNFAVGIPGTIGGAVRMNAGTANGCMGDVVDDLTVIVPQGEVVTFNRDQLEFAYRSFKALPLAENLLSPNAAGRFIVLKAGLRLNKGDSKKLAAEAKSILNRRLQTQPYQLRSAGCFFRNPVSGESAGKLIDLAGLKGRKIGCACVSEQHANFIVNTQTPSAAGSAKDFLALMGAVQQKVMEQFNIMLSPEVKVVGTETHS